MREWTDATRMHIGILSLNMRLRRKAKIQRDRMTISQLNRSRAASFFVGATLFWLTAFFLHKAGYIYIYTQDHQAEFRTFNEAVSKAQGDINQFEEVLLGAQAVYEKARAEGRLPPQQDPFLSVEKALPEFYKQSAETLVNRTNASFVMRWRGEDYKILINSELCAAVALVRPARVDPIRNKLPFFCRWFGIWSPMGSKL